MTKAIAILPVVSAIYPIKIGATAPPTMVMMSNDDAILVWVPASLKAKEKIVGNMMLSPKYKAKKAMWRISEATLLMLAILGGSIGAWLAMRVWHHKTMHKKFKYGNPIILLAQIALITYLHMNW